MLLSMVTAAATVVATSSSRQHTLGERNIFVRKNATSKHDTAVFIWCNSKTKAIRGQFFSHPTNLVYTRIYMYTYLYLRSTIACAHTKCVLIMNYDLFFHVKSNSISLGLFANFSFRIAWRFLQRGKTEQRSSWWIIWIFFLYHQRTYW